MIRYQEGNESESSFSGELSVVASFDNLLDGSGGDNTFVDANII